MGRMTDALRESLGDRAAAAPEDMAVRALAGLYAVQLDDEPDSLAKLGPAYLRVLGELHLTPRARDRADLELPRASSPVDDSGDTGEHGRDHEPNPLADLRRRRRRPKALDAAG